MFGLFFPLAAAGFPADVAPGTVAAAARPAPPFATFVSVSVALLSLIFELFLGNTTSSIARSPMGWCIR